MAVRTENMGSGGRSSVVECGTTVIKQNRYRRASLIGSVHLRSATQEGSTALARSGRLVYLFTVLDLGTALKICHLVTSSPHQLHNHRTRDRPKVRTFKRIAPKLLVLYKRVACDSDRLIIANHY